MEDSKFCISSENNPNLIKEQIKISCNKCGGSGNFKTSENLRRTCLSCFGRGFKIL